MAKILVFQHVPYEPLGTLDPLIRQQKHRIKYVNFGRNPHAQPSLDGYDALIILGGPMNVGDEANFPHLKTEHKLIQSALQQNMPILGICLGAQLIAAAAGARVYPAREREIGWYQMTPTELAHHDPVGRSFTPLDHVFQWHGYTFDLPPEAQLLVSGDAIPNQAFRIGERAYGLQFHLEANLALIKRWLYLPAHQTELGVEHAERKIDSIWRESHQRIERSLALSRQVFSAFLATLPKVKERHHFHHRHF